MLEQRAAPSNLAHTCIRNKSAVRDVQALEKWTVNSDLNNTHICDVNVADNQRLERRAATSNLGQTFIREKLTVSDIQGLERRAVSSNAVHKLIGDGRGLKKYSRLRNNEYMKYGTCQQ